MSNPGVVLIKKQSIVQVQSQFPIFPQYKNFSFTAIAGQSDFVLPAYPLMTGLFSMNINGAQQDILNGDFSVSGNVLTVSPARDAGDKVAGFFQFMSPLVNSSAISFRTFLFTAIQGQVNFPLGFVPKSIVYISINGTIQSPDESDYSISGSTLTTASPLDAGDKLFGSAIQ